MASLHDLQESADALVHFIKSSRTETKLRDKLQEFFAHHVETKETTTRLLNDIALSEEMVGQKLLDLEGQKSQLSQELNQLDQELQKHRTRSQNLDSEHQFLQRELERLRESDQEIQTLQQEVDEDTTEVIPSAIYLAQLYYKVTRIKLELDSEPHILKGVHYGKDAATPINIDTAVLSPCAVSDKLWDLVSTEWN
ncbi:kinetochore protein Spc24 [Denticeps clupeoides]|uniref:Kinetochore protein Spc24 n=1 Tax=Denticeps clupeoides TaxID=299321 RepID=A0AAY4CSU7_9TELE|nr:kinetochore protein Spc24 [Denticeps clupeoides]